MIFPEAFINQFDIRQNERILMLEADAATCVALAKRVPRGGVVGLQSSDDALRATRREARDVPNVMIQPGDADEIPFQDELFDWIFCPSDPCSLTDVWRVLAPGGFVVIADPGLEATRLAYALDAEDGGGTTVGGHAITVWRKRTPDTGAISARQTNLPNL